MYTVQIITVEGTIMTTYMEIDRFLDNNQVPLPLGTRTLAHRIFNLTHTRVAF